MSDEVVPRDVKIVHLILASMGVTQYQDHVPLQLMDFAHRYTTEILQDALLYSDYANQSGATQPAGMGPQPSALTVEDLKLAVSSRVAYQFKPASPKDLLMSLAAERNKRPLPPVPMSYGLRLPPEKHCLTGRDRDVDEDDDVVIAGYEKMDLPEEFEVSSSRNNGENADDEAFDDDASEHDGPNDPKDGETKADSENENAENGNHNVEENIDNGSDDAAMDMS